MNIYPYLAFSKSAKLLSQTLGIRRIRRENSKFSGGRTKRVMNWGAVELPAEIQKCNVINPAVCVAMASNKLALFTLLEEKDEARIPEFTQYREVAEGWAEDGDVVVCRTLLSGSSGRGIVIANSVDEIVKAPLYTKYVKKLEDITKDRSKGWILV